MSPTQRSLEYLRKAGYRVAIVERWNPYARIRQDLFGILDLVAIRDGETLGVQTTSGGNVSARVKKISESDSLPDLRRAGWSIHVHGWRKLANKKWGVRVVDLS